MWPFFHGMETGGQPAHQTQWLIFHEFCYFEIRCVVSCGSWTWCPLSQLPRRYHFPTDPIQYGSHPTKDTCTLQHATAAGIGNNTIKRQRLRSMEMQYFWVGDKVAQDMYTLSWHPGQENLANYQSKHHIGAHHLALCPWYLHQAVSPRVLPWALKPSALKRYVGALNNGYLCKVPLPRVPRDQSTIHVACTVGKSKWGAFTHIVSKRDAFTDRYAVRGGNHKKGPKKITR